MKLTKLYYSIGEVAEILEVETHVIRFWGSKFGLHPQRKSNRRKFSPKQVKKLLKIKNLLYEKKFTIEGAKKFLEEKKEKPKKNKKFQDKTIIEIRDHLHEILDIIDE